MVRTRTSIAAGDGEAVPPAVAVRGRDKASTRGHTVAARGRAPTRAQECVRAVSVDPPADQVEDQFDKIMLRPRFPRST